MRILIDSNVILDSLIGRQPFFDQSDYVIKLCAEKKVKGFAAAHTITNLFYTLRKTHSDIERRQIILKVFSILEIVKVNYQKLLSATLNFDFKDFEDCVQDECAAEVGADYIITRNVKDFKLSKIPAVTPEDFIKIFEKQIGEGQK